MELFYSVCVDESELKTIFMFAPCINSIKNTFIVPNDAHYYKIIEMLKQFKIMILASTCFGSRRNHQQGAVLCLAKTTNMFFSVLVGMDAVSVMAAYQPAAQACGSLCTTHTHHTICCRITTNNFYSFKKLKNFKFSDFNKEPTSSLKMI
jgi:hypothetical protein